MSKRKPDRTEEYEIKYLRGVLHQVDQSIALPPGLSADVLRQRLEGVEPRPQAAAQSTWEFIASRVFSLQSAVSYGVAFVIILVVVYGLQLNTEIPETGAITDSDLYTADDGGAAEHAQITPFSQAVQEQPEETIPPEPRADISLDAPAEPVEAEMDLADGAVPMGMGGGGQVVQNTSDGRYTYLYRLNDLTDPDKADYPLTLEVVDTGTEELLWQIDLPDMETIEADYFIEEGLVLVGTGSQGVVTRVYGFRQDSGAAEEIAAVTQPGTYKDSGCHEGVIYTVTYADDGEETASERMELPDSLAGESCVVTAVDVQDGDTNQIAYVGAGEDISLYRRRIYIPYPAQAEEGEEPGMNLAEILLDGTEMEMVLVD